MNIELSAIIREEQGKGASRRLRHNNQVPAIVYGDKKQSTNIAIAFKDINYLLNFNEEIYSSVLELKIDSNKEKVILKDLQRHPVRNIVTHIDFQRVNMKVEITTSVPLNIIGNEDNEAIRFGAVINKFIDTVEISCLPKNLPIGIEVDITKLQIGDSLSLTDLVVNKGVQITALNHDNIETYNQTVVSVSAPKIIEEEVEEVEEVEETKEDSSEDTNKDTKDSKE